MKKWILLVDDSADDVELTRLALEENNIPSPVIVARDGTEALALLSRERIEELGEFPAVVLLDLNMPKLDGMEVLRRIRDDQRTRLVPVVILTSSEEERDLIETYKLGANSYITKPVDFGEFLAAMQHLGFYWLLLNRIPQEIHGNS
jgi:two-component system response regulator